MKKNIKEYKIEVSCKTAFPASPKLFRSAIFDIIDGERVQITNTRACRELICYDIAGAMKYSKPLRFEKFRLVVHYNNPDYKDLARFRKNIFHAKRMLNIIERHMGWKKSTISTCKLNYGYDRFKSGWVIVGPKEWITYSQFTSFVLYVLRVVSLFGTEHYKKCETIADIQKYFLGLNKIKNIDYSLSAESAKMTADVNTAKFCVEGIEVLLNYKKIFENMTQEENWYNVNNEMDRSGMQSFVDKSYINYNKKVKKAKEKYIELKKSKKLKRVVKYEKY